MVTFASFHGVFFLPACLNSSPIEKKYQKLVLFFLFIYTFAHSFSVQSCNLMSLNSFIHNYINSIALCKM